MLNVRIKITCPFDPGISHCLTVGDFAQKQKIKNRCLAPQKMERTMKKQLITSKLTAQPGRFGSALAGLLLLAITAGSSSGQVLPPQSHPYGHSYATWSAKWWRWSLEQSVNNLELISKPDACDGHVRFLAGSLLLGSGGAASITNKVTISHGTPLFFPIISVWDDNSACPTFTSFTAEQLEATVEGDWTLVTLTTCTIDGVPVAGLSNPATTEYLTQSPTFGYLTAETGNVLADIFGDTCIDGGTFIYPAVADGVYLMLSPLSPGKHIIHSVGVVGPLNAPYVVEDNTYEITVSKASNCGGN
jgi:hypothetical protein